MESCSRDRASAIYFSLPDGGIFLRSWHPPREKIHTSCTSTAPESGNMAAEQFLLLVGKHRWIMKSYLQF